MNNLLLSPLTESGKMHFAVSLSSLELGQLQLHYLVCNVSTWMRFFFNGGYCPVSMTMSVCACSCHSGTKENLSASKILTDMWPKIESDADKHAVFLLR